MIKIIGEKQNEKVVSYKVDANKLVYGSEILFDLEKYMNICHVPKDPIEAKSSVHIVLRKHKLLGEGCDCILDFCLGRCNWVTEMQINI